MDTITQLKGLLESTQYNHSKELESLRVKHEQSLKDVDEKVRKMMEAKNKEIQSLKLNLSKEIKKNKDIEETLDQINRINDVVNYDRLINR